MPSFSSSSTSTPIWPSSDSLVVTSRRCGMWLARRVPAVRIDAHRMGSSAFFAPDTRTSPCSGTPPWISSLSIFDSRLAPGARGSVPGRLGPVLGSEGLHRQGVDLFAHALAKRLVHELVLLHPVAAAEGLADDDGFEVMAVAAHLDMLAGQP